MMLKYCRKIIGNGKTLLILLSFGFAIGPCAASAQITTPSGEALVKLETFVQDHLEKSNIPGCLTAVASKGKIVYLKSYGMSNVELSVPVSDSTVFEIGSISKQFVSAAAMQLVQEGKLLLDDPIQKYLSWIPGEWLGVTVKQLLTHTSGIPDYEEIRSYDVYRFRLIPDEIIKIAHSRPMDFEPGTGYYYSNTGYVLMSMIVERIDGHPLDNVLKSRIFDPLGMHQTRMAAPEAIIRHRASGYWVNKADELINRNPTETSSTLGAGGILSSVHDLVKWDAALYKNNILRTDSKKTMWTPAVLPDGRNTGYAFGWNVAPYRGMVTQNHSGQVAGFTSYFYRFPERELAFIVFVNRYRTSASPIRENLIRTFIPDPGSPGH